MKPFSIVTIVTPWLAAAMLAAQPALAMVSAQEAAALKSTLTPFGAERAGNKDGSIPAWTGGHTQMPPNYKSGDPPPDLFVADKPVLKIDAKNAAQYADKLSDGVKGLLKKYPDTFRLDVYPTRRTAAAPQWVYDNTFQNATRARTTDSGLWVEGAYGGIPFPIPKNGNEAMWNHKLQWTGETVSSYFVNYVGTPDGKLIMATKGYNKSQYPYYEKGGTADKYTGESQQLRIFTTEPPLKAGSQFLLIDAVNRPRQAWEYLTGQRRVRKAPTLGYDTPDDINSGQSYFDEAFVFLGELDRYNWKLVGKKEIYIPYNNNKVYQKGLSLEQLLMPHHANPDSMRWELHRVWVVEAELAPGKRHVVPKRRLYLDEDTWAAVLGEGWDAQGQLWRVQVAMPYVVPEGPFVNATSSWCIYNLLSGAYLAAAFPDYGSPGFRYHYKLLDRIPSSYFSPEALAGEGVR